MDSLYGGKPGNTFVLRTAFPSVEDMVKAFKGGPNYTTVWYNEYCIINTPNKNDKTNGQIYERGLDYQNNMGGAIYIGQVVGPSSGTPYFQLASIQSLKDLKDKIVTNEDTSFKRYPIGIDKDTGFYITSNGENNEALYIDAFGDEETEKYSLVPGKYIDDNGEVAYNDSIKYSWMNVRLDNADSDSWFYVGIEIPYNVTDFETEMTSQYDETGELAEDSSYIRRLDGDEKTHPFYDNFAIGVPKGIKGDAIRNLKVVIPTVDMRIYDVTTLHIDKDTGEAFIPDGSPEYAGKDEDVTAQRQIIVFDYYIYDKKINPEPIRFYVGDFNNIKDIKVEDDGTVVISYTHNDDTIFEQRIKWIDNIQLTEGTGKAGGHFVFTYNVDGDTADVKKTQEFDVSWIKGIEVKQDGHIIYRYAGTPTDIPANATKLSDGIYEVQDVVRWIKDGSMNVETGQLIINDNFGGQIIDTTLDWIKDITLDTDGTIHFWHTDTNAPNSINGEVKYDKRIKYVSQISLSNTTGKFEISFNTGESYITTLDWIDELYINETNGEIAVHHVNPLKNDEGKDKQVLNAKLKLIIGASVSSDGIITFNTNTGENINLKMPNSNTDFKLKYVDDIKLETPIEADKHIQIKYNTNTGYSKIGDSINYVQDMTVRPSDYHLLVLFNDPNHRAIASDFPTNNFGDITSYMATNVDQYLDKPTNTIKNPRYDNVQNTGPWVENIKSENKPDGYGAGIFWRDYGPIKDQSGVLIGGNISLESIPSSGGTTVTQQDVINYLNEEYPGGLNESNNRPGQPAISGKIITVDKEDTSDKDFYAYNYITGKEASWYYLGTIADSGARDAQLLEKNYYNSNKDEILKTVNNNSIVMIYEAQKTTAKLPDYYKSDYTGTFPVV